MSSVFPSDDAWSEAFKQIEETLPRIDSFKGKLAENPEILADWIDLESQVYLQIGKVYVYANMQYAVDTVDSGAKSKTDRAGALFARSGSRLRLFGAGNARASAPRRSARGANWNLDWPVRSLL